MDPGDVVGLPEASCGLPLPGPLANGLPAVWVWYDMVQYGIFWYCMVWISMIPYQIRSVGVAITLLRPLANGLPAVHAVERERLASAHSCIETTWT